MSAVGFLCYIFRFSLVSLCILCGFELGKLLNFYNLLQVVSAQSEFGGGSGTFA